MRFLQIIVFLIAVYPASLTAQEVESPLGYNDILRKEWIKGGSQRSFHPYTIPAAVNIPFLDDFSGTLIYPDTSLWMDMNVYINRDLPVGPITLGVATFDGVRPNGMPYDTITSNSNLSVNCDTLTSKPIDLSGITQTDTSVYLSFFYQARGRGEKPDVDDSLLLEFHSPVFASDTMWSQAWGRKGFSTSQTPDSIFRVVIVRVDTTYYKNGFQFRFRNKGTPSGYVDHWHIDYVYLNSGRSPADTNFRDVSFVYTPTSLLKKYQAMPYTQYKASEMTDSLTNYIRNNDSVYVNTFYRFRVRDGSSAIVKADSSQGNIESILDYSYTICTVPATGCRTTLRPPLNGYVIPDPISAPTDYSIEHFILPTTDFHTTNNLYSRKQVFNNYFAYDDGTAEMSYGLNVIGGKIAYRFTLNYADTLRGLDMYFNWMPNGTVNSNTQRQFRITVWNEVNGVPGSIIYQDSIVTPSYHFEYHSDWGYLGNVFYRYPLTSPKFIGAGNFYVGWVQYGTDLLNIGLDKNRNSNSNMYYNTSGQWQNSTIPGTWMIRPLFGTASQMQNVPEPRPVSGSIELYPNPAADIVYIQASGVNYDRMQVSILDAFGRVVMGNRVVTANSLNIAELGNGIYFVRISDEEGRLFTRKLIIAR